MEEVCLTTLITGKKKPSWFLNFVSPWGAVDEASSDLGALVYGGAGGSIAVGQSFLTLDLSICDGRLILEG